MRIGLAPLAVGVMVMAARLVGSDVAADALACVYLVVATELITRRVGAAAPLRD